MGKRINKLAKGIEANRVNVGKESLVDYTARNLEAEYKRGVKRGRRKADGWWRTRITALSDKLEAESQPTPKYTAGEAERLVALLVAATYGVAGYNNVENNDELADIRQTVVGVIAGSAKPVPQFDAEQVRNLIVDIIYNARSYGSHWPGTSQRTISECAAALREAKDALHAYLGIECKLRYDNPPWRD